VADAVASRRSGTGPRRRPRAAWPWSRRPCYLPGTFAP